MAHPNNPNADNLAVLERRKKVAARYVRGETQWEIARAFEVTQSTVSADLKAIRSAWLAEAVRDLSELKARELAKIDETEAQAWRAWTKSQENAEVLRARMRGGNSETEKVSKGQAGDPRFLELILKCVQKRCEILGILDRERDRDASKGQPTVVKELSGVSMDSL
jgi:predicted transcriptional regulator